MFKRQKRKSLYGGKSDMDVRGKKNKKSIIKILQLMIHGIVRRGKMPKEGKNISGFVHYLFGEREVEEDERRTGWRWKDIEEKEE